MYISVFLVGSRLSGNYFSQVRTKAVASDSRKKKCAMPLRIFWLKFCFKNFCMKYYWCYLDAVFTILQRIKFSTKIGIQHFYIGPILFPENKIIRSVVGGKVDGRILFGAMSEKPKILFGARGEKRINLFGAK